eukprot:TRINITY_DN7833_c0_g1_i1.p1 TRINITY_DN7833_c0_g1~~TRINITY_DN7833_c0_g1_i1.p1  ORF type:complete len:221 (+),score=38.17 TRINITY_DN7833_c0_g1_i1:51-713(+)
MAQLGLAAPKKVTYFGVKGAAFPAQCCLEIGGVEYEGKSVTMEEWAAVKPSTPTGVLPIMELADGSVIPESGAISRVCAGAAGLLGEGKSFVISEMLAGMVADLGKKASAICPTMMTVAKFDDAKIAAFNEGKPGVLAYLEKFNQFLLPSGDRFTESGCVFGEVELFCKLYQLSNGAFPEAATGGLAAFYNRMLALPGVKKVIDGETQFGPLMDYFVPLP